MRQLLYSLTIVLYLGADSGLAQDQVRWVQSTNLADSELVQEIGRKLDQLSPIRGSDRAIPLKQLMSMYPIVVLVDENALEDENISIDEPITVPVVPGISIRNQLKWILAPLQLTYVESPGYVTITSKKMSANVIRLYDVTELVSSSKGKYDFWSLIQIIEQSITPDAWQNAGGTSNMIDWRDPNAAILVVSAPVETHEAIYHLFMSHRELLKRSNSNTTFGRLRSSQVRSSTVRRSSLR